MGEQQFLNKFWLLGLLGLFLSFGLLACGGGSSGSSTSSASSEDATSSEETGTEESTSTPVNAWTIESGKGVGKK